MIKMRRITVLAIIAILLVPVVYAQTLCSGGTPDGNLDAGEECDDGNTINGDGCSDACTLEKDVNYVLFDLGMMHNLLFSKVQDLLHVIKDALYQLEQKTIEIQLTNYECSQQPVSFWIPANLDPYGKLNEIDSMIVLTIQSLNRGLAINGNAFGSPAPDTAAAQSLINDAEGCIAQDEYREAFECKCLAYRQELLGLTDTSVTCDPCGIV